ncbi:MULTISPECIES: AraC family transcriptional regulator [Paenibacillus]|uniref:AraC family transcriptional regulator n=1 Tax=Paenibacillus campinasensis TaxID=66347 RepID=A0A268EW61_9BACL|nr:MULTISPECIES: AraC family transcriptional regulator [Paenibacillus]PAD77362.1 AraC family transcriptional regulator [Paenibacillus campinasensis]PAK50296.1 AraC family transcriptional regulator [Paenibacillus sp. 7541]
MDRPQSILPDQIAFTHAAFPFTASTTRGIFIGAQRLHWHHALELNYIRSGTGYIVINGMRLSFKQGDLILINSNDLHRAYETDNLVMDVMMFEPSLLAIDLKYDPDLLLPFRALGTRFPHVVNADSPIYDELVLLFSRMMEENRIKGTSFMSLIRSDLIRFLSLANRHLTAPAQEKQRVPVPVRGMHALKEVLRTMELHFAYGWTLRELADLTHLSPSRFSALFQQVVGTSPHHYLIQLRLTHAVHLLETTDHKIIEIAESCGFRNLSNFNRLFKLHIGASPSEVRERAYTGAGGYPGPQLSPPDKQ